MTAQYAYLTVINGPRAGTHFLLDPTDRNRIGRGMDCDIVLPDPLCSRVHAELVQETDGWWCYDSGSRNGTLVNDQRIDKARLASGHRLRMGSTDFSFQSSAEPPTHAVARDSDISKPVVKEVSVLRGDTEALMLDAMRHSENVHDLVLLYQLSAQLLGCDNPDQVIHLALRHLHQRTNAAVIGFLWVDDEGKLKPKLVIPASSADEVSLSESLTDAVVRRGRAVWVAYQTSVAAAESLRQYADAICVPLVRESTTLGAIHMYLADGRFRQHDFAFAVSVAHVLGLALVRSRREAQLEADRARLAVRVGDPDQLLGESESMQQLRSTVIRVARATGCVLIAGESGTGKELVARALHRISPRADRPMLAVNCASIPAELLESQLFGHAAGAFTGAVQAHAGWFQQADTGILFLDEIGELSLEGQAKLLRVLEGHAFTPVGGSTPLSVDVRVLAATNRDLRAMVDQGRFREDLFYRLSVFEIRVPALRERGADLPLLIDHFFDHFRRQHGRPQLELSAAAREKLTAYSWPGNIRQLRNLLDSTVVLANGPIIEPDDLTLHDLSHDPLESLRLDYWEEQLIRRALQKTQHNVPEAALLLGIGRATLYRKIDEYGIGRNADVH